MGDVYDGEGELTTSAPIRPLHLREVIETPQGKVLKLNPHLGQYRTLESPAQYTFVFAGSGGGKTSWGPHWVDDGIRRIIPQLAPGEPLGDVLAVTSTYGLFESKMLPEIREVFEHILGIGRYWVGSHIMELRENMHPRGKFWAATKDDRMWGRLILRSAENPSGLEAATARLAWLDEVGQPEFSLLAWEAIRRRVNYYQGRVLGTTTLYNLGWLKNEVYDRWQAGDKDYNVIQFDSTMNPNFPREQFDREMNTMPRWKFDMQYRGKFARPKGMVYDCFDEAQCVIDRFPIPQGWLWHVGHDFGGSNPAAIIIAQDPGTGIFYVVGEYLPGAEAVVKQVATLKDLTRGRTVLRRMGGSHQEGGWRDDYTAQGWPVAEPLINDVEVGISRVYAIIKANRLMVFRDCTHLLDELGSYSYKLGADYQVTEEIENKARYHLLDALRYILGSFGVEKGMVEQNGSVDNSGVRVRSNYQRDGDNMGVRVRAGR